MVLSCGIVGLPNVGKSTLFNALTQTTLAQSANYPFCTIEPNIGRIAVPDDRLQKLAVIAKSEKIIPTILEFVDIAGLVKGASQGEGLGNQFLGHIQQVDAILYMIRCFEDPDIIHVMDSVDPVRDAQVIETELILADLARLDKAIERLEKLAKSSEDSKKSVVIAKRWRDALDQGTSIRDILIHDEDEQRLIKEVPLLTAKPALYVCNVDEDSLAAGTNPFVEQVKTAFSKASVLVVSAQIESELAQMSLNERQDYLEALGLNESGLDRIVRASYDLLGLGTFYTVGPKEAHAWTFQLGTLAPQAAGIIHTDFEKGFIRAEVIGAEDFISLGGEVAAKAAGKMRLVGKDYIFQDGDIAHFLFNL